MMQIELFVKYMREIIHKHSIHTHPHRLHAHQNMYESILLQISQNYELKFPSVTICNMNPVKMSVFDRVNTAEKKQRRKRYLTTGIFFCLVQHKNNE